MEMDQQKPHIAILPSPGIRHSIPLIELAKLLALHYNFHVTCIMPTIGPPSKAMTTVLEALPISIDRVFLPPVSSEDLHTVHTEIQICRAITLSLPSLRDVFKCLVATTWLAAFVGDVYHVFGCEAFEVAKEFKVMPYVFVSVSATVLSLGLHMPKLDETVQGEFRELPEPLKLPRWSIPIQGRDLLDALLDRQTEWYKLFLSHVKRLRLAERINQTGSSTNHVDESGCISCISWLENQPSGAGNGLPPKVPDGRLRVEVADLTV
ncbi:Hydroquinone glucosyltransferase [Morella rubra]|uniref:Hydroquinone glucosyltransferase n=1 Tax=Morella rubra TaxID=262757 RepID=A0A6A1WL84_9ROSI|nr:Hydroquinone glucosyltransferase [Morella rubra]